MSGFKIMYLWRRLFVAAAVLLSVGMSAGGAYAESLGDLLPGVVKNDDVVKAAQAELAAKKQEEKVIFGQWYPTLAVTANYGRESQKTETAADTTLVTRDVNLSATQLLWDFGNVNSQVREKRMEVAEVAARLKDSRQTIMRDVILAYINVLRFDQTIQIAERAIEIIVEQGRLEKQRLKIGAGTSTDVLKAQSKLASQEDLRVSLLKQLRTAKNAYRETTKSAPPPVKNMVRPRLPLDLMPGSVEEAIKLAMRDNPLLLSGRITSFINRQKVSTARASGFFPKVEGVFESKYKEDFAGAIGKKRETLGKLQMSYSFNLGGTAINTLRQNKETAKQWLSTYTEGRNRTEELVRNAWDKLRTSQERVRILTDGLAIHSKSLELVRKDRKKGKSTVLEVLDAIAQLTVAEGSLAFEEAEVLGASYELLYAMGRLNLAVVGGAGNQNFRGEGGNDNINGGAGSNDRVDYNTAESSVTVNLTTNTAEVNQNLGVRVELLEGPAVPMARLLAEEVSDRLEKSRVPATIDPTRPSRYILKGRTELNLLGKSDDDYIYIKWELQDNVGQVLGSHTQGVKATRTQWEFGDPRIIRSVGNGALGPILAMLPNAPKKKPAPARAPITTAMVVKPVIGAPGDGNIALTNAIEAALRAVDIFITKDPRQAANDGEGGTDTIINIEDIRGSNDFGDLLIGDAGVNTIDGRDGDDMIIGAGGNDVLIGGLGSDFLDGGADVDNLTGGGDSDIFRFSATTDSGLSTLRDTITDFDASSVNEVIFLDGLLNGVFQSGISAGGNTGFTATTEGSDTQVLIDTLGDGTADMEILLQNVSSGDVDITDFLVTS